MFARPLTSVPELGGRSETGSSTDDMNLTYVTAETAHGSRSQKVNGYSIALTSSGTLYRVGFFLERCFWKSR